MRVRDGWLIVPLLCLSCTALGLPEPAGQPGTQQAAEGAPDGLNQVAAESTLPAPSVNSLRLATTCLDDGKVDEACDHLAEYLWQHPGQFLVRARYAELLLRLRRVGEARDQFERAVADCTGEDRAITRCLVHCHRRLMDIAAAQEDACAEHLHRGIGLYLLARERDRLGGSDEGLPAESLLCKAAAELTLAQTHRAGEARPAWYLHRVWALLGQQQAAQRSLREALDAAPFTPLTPDEQRGLYAADQQRRSDEARR